jgi:hypothetical protein
MSTSVKAKSGKAVIEAILTADTPRKKAKATKLRNDYVAQRVAEGKDPKKVLGGLISRVNVFKREAEAKAAPAAKATTKPKTAKTPPVPQETAKTETKKATPAAKPKTAKAAPAAKQTTKPKTAKDK